MVHYFIGRPKKEVTRFGTVEAIIHIDRMLKLGADGEAVPGTEETRDVCIVRIRNSPGSCSQSLLELVDADGAAAKRILVSCSAIGRSVIFASRNPMILDTQQQARKRRNGTDLLAVALQGQEAVPRWLVLYPGKKERFVFS